MLWRREEISVLLFYENLICAQLVSTLKPTVERQKLMILEVMSSTKCGLCGLRCQVSCDVGTGCRGQARCEMNLYIGTPRSIMFFTTDKESFERHRCFDVNKYR